MRKKEKIKKYYDILMAVLALIVVAILIFEFTTKVPYKMQKIMDVVDTVIWVIFCLDYFARLIISKSKKKFVKENIVDLISIIPLDASFKAVRIFRVTKLIKLSKMTKVFRIAILLSKFKHKMSGFLKTNNLNYVIYITITTIILGAVGISVAEKMSFANSLWWSFVTTTTVGYGDLSPTTALGRIIAVILMIVGIGFVGMLTGTIATFFLKNKEVELTYRENVIEDIKNKLDEFDSLSIEEVKDICNVLESLKN